MSGSPFIPRAYQAEPESVIQAMSPSPKLDKISHGIHSVVQYIVCALMLLIPLFFVPGLPASLSFDKVLLSVVLGLSVIVLLGLSALRQRKTDTVLPWALVAFFGAVASAFISGALSGDISDSLRGSVMEPQTAAFFAVMGLLMVVPLVFQRSKKMSLRALLSFGIGAILVILYSLSRVVFGPDFLSLQSFGSATVTPVGSFNDLAVFAGMVIIIASITLLQLPLKKVHQWCLATIALLALIIMAVVNFFSLWLFIGFFALLLLVYIFSRDTLFSVAGESRLPISPVLILLTIIVCVTSIVFVVAGDYVGSKINQVTQINYLEVRPSMAATLDITRDVYKTDVLLGVGPNKFADAWRLHKDPSINETIFWNTNFNAGYGFVSTQFVTLGVLGGLALVVFQVLYVMMGYRMLLKGSNSDDFWYYFGATTFLVAFFLWGISHVYVLGPAILLLAALFTGLSFVAFGALVPEAVKTVSLVSNRRRGFLLMVCIIVLIIGSVSTVFTVAKQYVAQAAFTEARISATTPAEFQNQAIEAYRQYQDDTFLMAIAQTRIIELQQLLAVEEPSEQDQQRFVEIARQAVLEAEEAINLDDSNPVNHATLADIFSILAVAGFTDASERVSGKIEDARWRDPLNPMYKMAEASLAVRLNDLGKARVKIAEALELKRNYSEALFLLTQIDVQDGKIDDAIATAQQIITLEPDNPTRYYQLGLLQAAKPDFGAAIQAYEAAIQIDSNFANARYMLALAYLESNRIEDGLTQLRIVRESNQDNAELISLINQIESNGYTPGANRAMNEVNEATPQQEGENVTSPTNPDTNLVSPVNTVGQPENQNQSSNQPAE